MRENRDITATLLYFSRPVKTSQPDGRIRSKILSEQKQAVVRYFH